ITDRGPFDEVREERLLRDNSIEVIVAKNSGGSASYGKIAAARALGIDVVLIKRPELPNVPSVGTIEEVLRHLAHVLLPR
ncbi:MAG TPA: precorrin-6A/cobalt-precorrin-6A reductase, partial [Pseudorhizobium sp.]|nr:precorrin-6A/cobalt-precorrin-6A reductase [Pseudorhizobium sp.]